MDLFQLSGHSNFCPLSWHISIHKLKLKTLASVLCPISFQWHGLDFDLKWNILKRKSSHCSNVNAIWCPHWCDVCVCKFQKMGGISGTLLSYFHHLPWKTLKQVAVLQSAAFQYDKLPVLYVMFNVTHHKERCKWVTGNWKIVSRFFCYLRVKLSGMQYYYFF